MTDIAPPPVTRIPDDAACHQCGYALAGLPSEGVCPECGLPVEQSLRSNMLEHASPSYLAALHRGVFLVLAAIIVQILLGFAGVAVGFAMAGSSSTATFMQLFSILGVAVSLTLVYGWWLFTAPDPGYEGRRDASQARQIVRITLAVNVAIVLLQMIFQLAPSIAGGSTATLAPLVALLALVVFAVSFFASMLYLRWLTPRIPNWKAFKRAKTLMWLGPLLYTVGILLIGLGPLIALVLYWNMLDWIRKDLKRIRKNLPA